MIVDAALNRLLNSETAYLLQVCIPPEECVWPLVPPGACNTDMPKFEKIAGLCRHRPLLTNPSTAYSGPPPFTREAKW